MLCLVPSYNVSVILMSSSFDYFIIINELRPTQGVKLGLDKREDLIVQEFWCQFKILGNHGKEFQIHNIGCYELFSKIIQVKRLYALWNIGE